MRQPDLGLYEWFYLIRIPLHIFYCMPVAHKQTCHAAASSRIFIAEMRFQMQLLSPFKHPAFLLVKTRPVPVAGKIPQKFPAYTYPFICYPGLKICSTPPVLHIRPLEPFFKEQTQESFRML